MDLKARLIAVSKELMLSNKTSSMKIESETNTQKKVVNTKRKRCRGCEAIRNFFVID